jgi:acyl carrier protein
VATISERTKKVIVSKLGAEEASVVPMASFSTDLGADSLDLVELIMALEEEFSTPDNPVKIPDEDANKLKTVQDAIDYLTNLKVPEKQIL